MEPEPAGSRDRPPSLQPTRNGTGEIGKSVLVALRDELESRTVSETFRQRGWAVERGSLADIDGVGPDLILTDELDLLVLKGHTIHPDPNRTVPGESIVFVLSDPDGAAIHEAWSSGCDWVLPRPFDPEDPLKTNEFTR